MIIGSIDPAIKNLGLAVWNSKSQHLVHLGKTNLLCPTTLEDDQSYEYRRAVIPRLCRQYVEEHADLFKTCDFIAIEGQMLSCHIQISLVLEALLSAYAPTLIVHPVSVKKFFGTGTGNYTQNKKASVAKCHEILSPEDWQVVTQFEAKKRDDVADAILQAIYVAENTQLVLKKHDSVLQSLDPHKKKKKKRKRKK